jgi:dihydrofolate reductase
MEARWQRFPGASRCRWTGSSPPTIRPMTQMTPTITSLACSVREAIATAAQAAGEKKAVIFGANLARQCMEEGLIDESSSTCCPPC